MGEPVFCYVDTPWAFFTTQELERQTGENWDQRPYEEHSGRPTPPRPGEGHTIVQVAFEANLEEPADWGDGARSGLSAQEINAGRLPWLASPGYSDRRVSIAAGTTLAEFKRIVRSIGGTVFLDEERSGNDRGRAVELEAQVAALRAALEQAAPLLQQRNGVSPALTDAVQGALGGDTARAFHRRLHRLETALETVRKTLDEALHE